MHTVEQAKQTLCPASFMVPVENNGPWNCCATGCGAWRWMMLTQHGAGAAYGRDGELRWGEKTEPPETARGFCGLAPMPSR